MNKSSTLAMVPGRLYHLSVAVCQNLGERPLHFALLDVSDVPVQNLPN